MAVIKPIAFYEMEIERLRQLLDRSTELLHMSAGLNMRIVQEYIDDHDLKLRKKK